MIRTAAMSSRQAAARSHFMSSSNRAPLESQKSLEGWDSHKIFRDPCTWYQLLTSITRCAFNISSRGRVNFAFSAFEVPAVSWMIHLLPIPAWMSDSQNWLPSHVTTLLDWELTAVSLSPSRSLGLSPPPRITITSALSNTGIVRGRSPLPHWTYTAKAAAINNPPPRIERKECHFLRVVWRWFTASLRGVGPTTFLRWSP